LTKNSNLDQRQLHEAFVSALGPSVETQSDVGLKPLELDLKAPLPRRIRLYLYNLTHPPGGRTLGEHKVQLIVPGQQRGERASFDHSSGRIVILAGYEPEIEVFALWDAGLYPDFSYSRNVQVRAETIYAALAGKIGLQQRRIRGQGKEFVIAARPINLPTALWCRVEITRKRLVGQ